MILNTHIFYEASQNNKNYLIFSTDLDYLHFTACASQLK